MCVCVCQCAACLCLCVCVCMVVSVCGGYLERFVAQRKDLSQWKWGRVRGGGGNPLTNFTVTNKKFSFFLKERCI